MIYLIKEQNEYVWTAKTNNEDIAKDLILEFKMVRVSRFRYILARIKRWILENE